MSLRDAIDRRFPDSKPFADLRDRCIGLRIQAGDFPLLVFTQLAACPSGAFTLPAARRLSVPGLRCLGTRRIRLHGPLLSSVTRNTQYGRTWRLTGTPDDNTYKSKCLDPCQDFLNIPEVCHRRLALGCTPGR